jgi:broad specificity phosphatase PhoE
MKQIYFIRHGQTQWNAIKRMQGQLNSDLNEVGKEQADMHGRFLMDHKLETLIASPLGRTTETAEIINQHLNLDVSFDERIKEWHCGEWSGLLWDDLPQTWPEEWQAYEDDRYYYRGPGCENFPDMIERVKPFLQALIGHPANKIGVVSHGLIGRVMIATMMQMDESSTMAFRQANDVVYRVSLSKDTPTLEHFIEGHGPIPGWVASDHYP